MDLKEAVFTRKSCRSFKKELLSKEDENLIKAYIEKCKPLYPNVEYKIKIEDKKDVSCLLPYAPDQFISFYSKKDPGYGLNIGYIGEQLVLYMTTLGIASCWIGLSGSKNKEEKLPYVISIGIGYAKKEATRAYSDFKRKPWNQFSDRMDQRLDAARVAPSSVNSQPWFFTHEEDYIHMWYVPQKGSFGKTYRLMPSKMNEIDLGIALAHMIVSYPSMTFEYKKTDPYLNYKHICAFKLNE